MFYWYFLYCYRHASGWWQNPILVSLGLISLMFRQTNIFWVVVFPAGIVLVRNLDKGHEVVKESMYRRAEGFGDSFASVARTSWKMEVVYDPSVRDAWLEGEMLTFAPQIPANRGTDYIKSIVSLMTCLSKALSQPTQLPDLLLALAPYLTLLTAFAAFVVWNGGVVLGDKSNHTATIHLPQMLYIWPYFTFFSWPIIYPYLSALPLGLLAKLSKLAPLESMLIFKRRGLMPRLWLTCSFIAAACLVVRYNTIVHPFLLADNRHYMFYVFRLLMRRWWIKYAVTPIYVCCAWACIQALGARPFNTKTREGNDSVGDNRAFERRSNKLNNPRVPDGINSASTTFVIIWLATTTLQLITAPLVEPRYFILPWIFWRMHVPIQQYPPADDSSTPQATRMAGLDHRLWMETAWFLLINAVTGYIFLNWEFFWPQEPEQVQRFMW